MANDVLRNLADSGTPVEEICKRTGLDRKRVARYVSVRKCQKSWYKEHSGHTADKNRLKRFGVSRTDYDEMLSNQDGLCAICGCQEKAKYRGTLRRLAVDHCHETGSVRKLLCARCNMVLGAIGDDVSLLWKMVSYLSQHKTQIL
jgi:hypothetical protein